MLSNGEIFRKKGNVASQCSHWQKGGKNIATHFPIFLCSALVSRASSEQSLNWANHFPCRWSMLSVKCSIFVLVKLVEGLKVYAMVET